MYVIKNALRCIGRSKGRNVLIGIIVLVIAVSACLGLSIKQAAVSAREDTLSTLSVTATISFDRLSAMGDMSQPPDAGGQTGGSGGGRGGFDRDSFSQMMGASSSLTLEQYTTYAAAEAVQDFYYTLTASFNGGEGLEPVSNDATTEENTGTGNGFASMGGGRPGAGGGFNRVMGGQSDFTVIGYSGDAAMTAFIDGTATIEEGAVFAEGTEAPECIISAELATFNGLSVGDTLLLANPNNEEETYPLTVVGTYADSSANESSFSMMGMTATDPANRIYMSAAALQTVLDASAAVSTTVTDENTGREFETAVTGQLAGTYVFATAEDYYRFEEQARALGLEDSYAVSSADITAFEASLTPLNTLSTMAGYFLAVILLIGAVILVVLNIFNVRERKYEIGVLTAMGMKKGKVAAQLMTEIFAVTMVAVLLGVLVGGVSALPVTNALLEGQVASRQTQSDRVEQGFGRDGNFGGRGDQMGGQMGGRVPEDKPSGGGMKDMFTNVFGQQAVDYVTEIHSAMNLTVVVQMLGIAILLTLVAGTVSMLFVMRYEPLRILSNRD